MTLIALQNKIIITPFKIKEQNISGIIIPENAEKRDGQGMIVAIGNGIKNKEFHVGDFIVYKEWAGVVLRKEDKTYIVIEEDDIIAMLTQEYLDDLGISVSEQAQQYFNSMVQPFRYGKFSKEFAEAYPEKTQQMIEVGAVTGEEVANAKYQFKDLAGWKSRKKSK